MGPPRCKGFQCPLFLVWRKRLQPPRASLSSQGRFKWLLTRQGKAKVESQDVLGVTGKFGLGVQNEAGQRLTEFWQENALIITSIHFQLHKRRFYMWTSPDGHYWNLIDYILCSWRWRSSIQSVKTRPGADCGSGHELLIAKFRLKLKA